MNIYDYSEWYKEKLDNEEELEDLLPVKGDEEKYYSVLSTPLSQGDKKEGKGFKILAPNKLLIRIPILLAQIKAAIIQQNKNQNQTNAIFFLSA